MFLSARAACTSTPRSPPQLLAYALLQSMIGCGMLWSPMRCTWEVIANIIQLIREPAFDDAWTEYHSYLPVEARAAFNDEARRSTRQYAFAHHHVMCAVLNAASVCRIFSRRSARAHYLQPPPRIGIAPSLPSLHFASLCPMCRDNRQRLRLLCISFPLSIVALGLACAEDNTGSCSLQGKKGFAAGIMARCFSITGWRLLAEWRSRMAISKGLR
jgi:hypothetical protein